MQLLSIELAYKWMNVFQNAYGTKCLIMRK